MADKNPENLAVTDFLLLLITGSSSSAVVPAASTSLSSLEPVAALTDSVSLLSEILNEGKLAK